MRRTVARGFTLVEMMVTLAVASIVLTAAYGMFVAQTQSYAAQTSHMFMQQNARSALEYITTKLDDAAYGVDPSLAFDMNVYGCSTAGTPTATCSGYVRDGSSAGTDQLVFYNRDKNYNYPIVGGSPNGHVWNAAAASAGSLSVSRRGTGDNATFRKGQILLVECPGTSTYTYVTVDANAAAPSAAQTQALTLTSTVSSDPFKRGDLLGGDTCFATARVYLIERHRFFIQSYTTANVSTPYLIHDSGTDENGDGVVDSSDQELVASDVEDLQVSYLTIGGAKVNDVNNTSFTLPDFSSPPTSPVCSQSSASNFYDAVGYYHCAYTDAGRLTAMPGNVNAVRVTLVTRSKTEPNLRGDDQPAVENHTSGLATSDKRRRFELGTTVSINNMLSRAQFL